MIGPKLGEFGGETGDASPDGAVPLLDGGCLEE